MAAGKVRVRLEGEKQKKETHRKPAPFAAGLPGTPLLKAPFNFPLRLSGGACGHVRADTYRLDHKLDSPLPLNPEPSRGQGLVSSLLKLGREKRPLSEGELEAAPTCTQWELFTISFKQGLTRLFS